MKSFIRNLIMMTLLLMLTEPLAVAAIYQFNLDAHHLVTGKSINTPKVVESHSLTINGVKMNTFNTTFENPKEMSVLSFRARAVKSKLKAEYLKKFDLYGMPNGNVFVPENWKLIYVELGQDDSLSYTFAPEGQRGYLTFTHTASCLNCATREASLFFEQARATQPYYTDANLPLRIVKIKPNLVAYGSEKNGYRIEGAAYYDPNAHYLPFWKVEVALPEDQVELANPLLNQFITIYE